MGCFFTLILERAQHGDFRVIHRGLRPQVFFTGIHTFPIHVLLTEFAIQHISWHIFLADFASFSSSRFNLLALFGSEAGVIVKRCTGGPMH